MCPGGNALINRPRALQKQTFHGQVEPLGHDLHTDGLAVAVCVLLLDLTVAGVFVLVTSHE